MATTTKPDDSHHLSKSQATVGGATGSGVGCAKVSRGGTPLMGGYVPEADVQRAERTSRTDFEVER